MPPRQCSRSRSWRVQHSCVPSRIATVSPSPALPFSISAVLYSIRPAAACAINQYVVAGSPHIISSFAASMAASAVSQETHQIKLSLFPYRLSPSWVQDNLKSYTFAPWTSLYASGSL